MRKFADKVRETPSCREPAYRPAMYLSEEEKADLASKIGNADLYMDLTTMREMVQQQPDNIELRKALVSGIASAEFAGIDAFSRKVVEWQEWPVPNTLIMAIARQTWDEVRHAALAKGLIESYGGKIGDYPDTLAGGAPPPGVTQSGPLTQGVRRCRRRATDARPGGQPVDDKRLARRRRRSRCSRRPRPSAAKIGDGLMAHCYDYNWADEVTHTAIGDYFVKLLTEDRPEEEAKALRVHAMAEAFRSRLNGEQSDELKEFFADEMSRSDGGARIAEQAPPALGVRFMAVVAIDLTACINCGWCRRVCPTETIKYFSTGHRTHVVEPDGCIDCGICVPVCPVNCIHPVPEYAVPADKLESGESDGAHLRGEAAQDEAGARGRRAPRARSIGREERDACLNWRSMSRPWAAPSASTRTRAGSSTTSSPRTSA